MPRLDEDYLILLTIHSAKGQEWKSVSLLSAVDEEPRRGCSSYAHRSCAPTLSLVSLHEATTTPGLEALGNYHERRDPNRDVSRLVITCRRCFLAYGSYTEPGRGYVSGKINYLGLGIV
jgi:hypothetical protein